MEKIREGFGEAGSPEKPECPEESGRQLRSKKTQATYAAQAWTSTGDEKP